MLVGVGAVALVRILEFFAKPLLVRREGQALAAVRAEGLVAGILASVLNFYSDFFLCEIFHLGHLGTTACFRIFGALHGRLCEIFWVEVVEVPGLFMAPGLIFLSGCSGNLPHDLLQIICSGLDLDARLFWNTSAVLGLLIQAVPGRLLLYGRGLRAVE